MSIVTSPEPAARPARVLRRGLLAGLVVAALTAPVGPLTPVAAGPSVAAAIGAATASPVDATPTNRTLVGTHHVTLLTGDIAALHVTADGRQAAWIADPVDPDADADADVQIYEVDGEVHVVPAEAAPYVASDALDEKLFNLTQLVRGGYDDQASDELPLLVEAADTRSAMVPAVPDGADMVRELDSVDTVSVSAAKAEIRTTWESLRGPTQARIDSANARLANGATVWLNGPVETTLDESVAQIGAPQAWARGYDGDGITVAVLDTGYDPQHPDLADQVVGAEDFTDGADPADAVAVDGNGHGTHVAATVGGTGAASDGRRRGVAPGTDLLIGKVLDDEGFGSTDQIIAGMEWAVAQGADVVNLSVGTTWASDGTDPMSQAVNELTRSSDTLFVVAAGNSGPGEESVGSPGAADLALTVGAVTKEDEPAAFSSRGPRLGDGAIKPEITAPGADIVAARAAGTSLGNLLDATYTSINGTSMATPHVAGAAAILAQQHPDWGAADLKARLLSTSRTLPDQPITFQGAGRVDVAAATRGQVTVDAGTLSLGRLADTADPVTRQLTYDNASDRRVLLRLTSSVRGTGSDAGTRPALRLSREIVSIPADGSTDVTVTLTPRSTEPGGYAGQIVARPTGGFPTGPIHTTVTFVVDGPLRTVTVEAVDRSGQPATGPVDIWSAETGERVRAFLREGTATAQVPEGLYSLVASVEPATPGSVETTIAAEPELRIDADRTVRFDARDGHPIRVETPRRTDFDIFNVMWHRSVGRRSMSSMVAQGNMTDYLYALRSPRARTGTFTLATQWQLQQPLLTVEAGRRVVTTSQQASALAYDGRQTLPLVDAGDGTSEAFAAVDVDGAVAVVSRGPAWTSLAAQAESAAAAGAEVLLAYNTVVDRWTDSAGAAPIPVYRLERAAGQDLLDAAAAGDRVEVSGVRDSTYQYELGYTEEGRVPDGRTYTPRSSSLATVESDYRKNSDRHRLGESWIPYLDGIGVANAMSQQRTGPLVRTDYVNTDGVEWQRFGSPSVFPSYYWTGSNPQDYRAGRRYHQVWWGPLVHPAVPPPATGATSAPVLGGGYQPVTRYRDALRIHLPHYSYGGSLAGTIYEQFGDQSELTLSSGGETLGTWDWPRAQYTVPAGPATYDLTLDVVNGAGNWSDTSVSTTTTWRFASARTSESGVAVPLVQVDYGLDTDGFNAMPAGASYPLVLKPAYQPEANGPGRFTAEVEVSFDDGATWVEAPVERDSGRFRAEVPAADGPGFASVRVVVTDADGNRLTQRIDRAWRIAAP